ncbi:MAG: hypothetical protein ACTXOO_00995 [Sodalis sp. (in: enterobacteria)]
MEKSSKIVKQRGRKTDSKYRKLERLPRLDQFPTNYAGISDSHGMKIKVIYPDYD